MAISVYQGNTKTVDLSFVTDSGVGYPLNISGYTGWFTAKRSYTDTTGQAIVNKQIVIRGNGTTGLAYLYLTTGDTSFCAQQYLADITLYGISGDVTSYAVDGGYVIMPSVLGGG